jgi:hypothetical protein
VAAGRGASGVAAVRCTSAAMAAGRGQRAELAATARSPFRRQRAAVAASRQPTGRERADVATAARHRHADVATTARAVATITGHATGRDRATGATDPRGLADVAAAHRAHPHLATAGRPDAFVGARRHQAGGPTGERPGLAGPGLRVHGVHEHVVLRPRRRPPSRPRGRPRPTAPRSGQRHGRVRRPCDRAPSSARPRQGERWHRLGHQPGQRRLGRPRRQRHYADGPAARGGLRSAQLARPGRGPQLAARGIAQLAAGRATPGAAQLAARRAHQAPRRAQRAAGSGHAQLGPPRAVHGLAERVGQLAIRAGFRQLEPRRGAAQQRLAPRFRGRRRGHRRAGLAGRGPERRGVAPRLGTRDRPVGAQRRGHRRHPDELGATGHRHRQLALDAGGARVRGAPALPGRR